MQIKTMRYKLKKKQPKGGLQFAPLSPPPRGSFDGDGMEHRHQHFPSAS